MKIEELIENFLTDWDELRDFVLEAPILSNDLIELRKYVYSIKDYIKIKRKKWESYKL